MDNITGTDRPKEQVTNGAALAAFLAAGIGALAMGLVIILSELGLLSLPALYRPAGGVSSRTTLAALIWLLAWVVLHKRWSGRELDPGRVFAVTLLFIALGVFLTFPPVWSLVS
jgi:multisubunit Na+/H+ antiporter MnhG subunit